MFDGNMSNETIKKALIQSVEHLVEGNQKDMINVFNKQLNLKIVNIVN